MLFVSCIKKDGGAGSWGTFVSESDFLILWHNNDWK